MNVKELKERAEAWLNSPPNSEKEKICAQRMFDAIRSLPDDPPTSEGSNQDLVEMAHQYAAFKIFRTASTGSPKSLRRRKYERWT